MKKVLGILLLLCVCSFSLNAKPKNGKLKLAKTVRYEGIVDEKQPAGEGGIYYCDGTTPVLRGNFRGNIVQDGAFIIETNNQIFAYKGDLSFSISNDKSSSYTIRYKLSGGTLIGHQVGQKTNTSVKILDELYVDAVVEKDRISYKFNNDFNGETTELAGSKSEESNKVFSRGIVSINNYGWAMQVSSYEDNTTKGEYNSDGDLHVTSKVDASFYNYKIKGGEKELTSFKDCRKNGNVVDAAYTDYNMKVNDQSVKVLKGTIETSEYKYSGTFADIYALNSDEYYFRDGVMTFTDGSKHEWKDGVDLVKKAEEEARAEQEKIEAEEKAKAEFENNVAASKQFVQRNLVGHSYRGGIKILGDSGFVMNMMVDVTMTVTFTSATQYNLRLSAKPKTNDYVASGLAEKLNQSRDVSYYYKDGYIYNKGNQIEFSFGNNFKLLYLDGPGAEDFSGTLTRIK